VRKFLGLVCAVALVFEMANIAHAKIQIAAGSGHTVGLKSNGTVVATGRNEHGECNIGDWTDVSQVAAGLNNTVGLKSDGTVVAVGWNYYGQCNIVSWTDISNNSKIPHNT